MVGTILLLGAFLSTASGARQFFECPDGDGCAQQPQLTPFPPFPPNVLLFPGQGVVVVDWSPSYNGGEPVSSWNVYRGTSPSTLALVASVGPARLILTDSSVTDGVTYFYAVTGTNELGEGDSNPGQTVPGDYAFCLAIWNGWQNLKTVWDCDGIACPGNWVVNGLVQGPADTGVVGKILCGTTLVAATDTSAGVPPWDDCVAPGGDAEDACFAHGPVDETTIPACDLTPNPSPYKARIKCSRH